MPFPEISASLLNKFFKYALVGFSGMLIDFGTTWTLKEKLGMYKYLANSLGFTAAVTNNYILNRIWTFHSDDPAILLQWSKFFTIALIGLGINNLIIYLLHDKLHIRFYLAKFFAIGMVILWNFTFNYFYTFHNGGQ